MKNWEFYEEELKNMDLLSLWKIIKYAFVLCDRCMFDMGEANSCDVPRMKWLYQEYKEPVVLTDDEKSLCKLLGRGWIARDKNGKLYWFENKPTNKINAEWITSIAGTIINIDSVFPQCKFEFIKWEDEEPWEVKVDG